ncbi:MAG: hypothetical protein ACM3QZ_15065 [Solirubrobacterales bacterium]
MKWTFVRGSDGLVSYRETLLTNKIVSTVFIDKTGAYVLLDKGDQIMNVAPQLDELGMNIIFRHKHAYIAECDRRRIVKRGKFSDLVDGLAYKRMVEIIEYLTDNLTAQMEERLVSQGLD